MKNIEFHPDGCLQNTILTMEEACKTHGVYRLELNPDSTYLMFGRPNYCICLTWDGVPQFTLYANCRDQSRLVLDEAVNAVTLTLPDRS